MSEKDVPEGDTLVQEDSAKYNGNTQELDRLGSVLVEADEIKSDEKLHKLVQERLRSRAERITSIAGLREKIAGDTED